MPGITGRMSTVIKAKISKMLDRAEDPGETLDYSYQKQMEMLQQVKKGIADVVTAKKRLQLQADKIQQSLPKLDPQARQALSPGPRGPRAHRAGAQELRADRAAVARPAGQGARGPAAAADRQAAEAGHQARAVPHQEGGHQGAVLRRRGLREDLRGRDRRRRGDGRRRARDAARPGQDGEHAGPRERDGRARGRRRVRRQLSLGDGQDDIDKQLAQLATGAAVDDELARMKAELGHGLRARRRRARDRLRPASRATEQQEEQA